ncbi:MAG: DUF4913 domain-containing protein [Rhodococcus sp. (in: high G+C Gram-positive bacteria)]
MTAYDDTSPAGTDPVEEPPAERQYESMFEWFDTWFATLITRKLAGTAGKAWRVFCPEWWRHDEVVRRLRDLWLAWEGAEASETAVPRVPGEFTTPTRCSGCRSIPPGARCIGAAGTAREDPADAPDSHAAACRLVRPLSLGLLTRVENMAYTVDTDLAKAEHSLDRDEQRLDDLELVELSDFPKAAQLRDLSNEVSRLRREIKEAETSPEAVARDAARAERAAAKGREKGWSLMLNPTPALVEQLGMGSADDVRAMMHRAATEALQRSSAPSMDLDGPNRPRRGLSAPPEPREPGTGHRPDADHRRRPPPDPTNPTRGTGYELD